MHETNCLLHYPSTPVSRRQSYSGRSHEPLNSSPLASYSPKSSPIAAAQARRRSQFKSKSSSITTGPFFSNGRLGQRSVSMETPKTAFLRERFKLQCVERAQKARERTVKGKRRIMSEGSSDGFDDLMDDAEEEESEEAVMQDELFHRIMQNSSHRQNHQYKTSYAWEVGSSFDPDMEDVPGWEHDLKPKEHAYPPTFIAPDDLDNEETEAYMQEYMALAEFEDLAGVLDDPTDLSDMEDNGQSQASNNSTPRDTRQSTAEDVEMGA